MAAHPGHPWDPDNKRVEDITDACLHLLGLYHVKDTLVGDEMVRGVSGGEKKRLTIAEGLVGPYLALFMDEISTGLDRWVFVKNTVSTTCTHAFLSIVGEWSGLTQLFIAHAQCHGLLSDSIIPGHMSWDESHHGGKLAAPLSRNF